LVLIVCKRAEARRHYTAQCPAAMRCSDASKARESVAPDLTKADASKEI
jgi:hypothetical protein